MTRTYRYVAAALILLARLAAAQEPGREHRFWDRTNKILFSSHAALEALDFGITHHNLSAGGREMDSMARALCQSGTAGQIVFFGGRSAGVVGVSYLLHKAGLHKIERLFPIYASGDSGYGIGYSFAHR